MKKQINLFQKYRSIIAYLFFGGLTTFINLAVYYVCYYSIGIGSDSSTVIAWFITILAVFVTNKPFVFDSYSWKPNVWIPELFNFFLCRIGTGVVEIIMMHILVEILLFPGMVMKLLTNIIVIILNYVASKLIVFRKRHESNKKV